MTTKRTLTAAFALLGVALSTTACQIDDTATGEYVNVCRDRYTHRPLPDYECMSDGLYPRAADYWMPEDRYQQVVHNHYYDRPLDGGATSPPRSGQVRIPSRPGKVTVYDAGKRTVTTNKQANSFGTVTKKTKTTNVYKAPTRRSPAWGTPQKSTVKKSGRCC